MQSTQREIDPSPFFGIGGSLECQLVLYSTGKRMKKKKQNRIIGEGDALTCINA